MTFETKLNKTGNIVSSDISKESSEKAFKDSVVTGVNLEQSKCVMSNLKNYIFWLRTRGDVVRKGYFYACIGVMNKHQHAYSVHSKHHWNECHTSEEEIPLPLVLLNTLTTSVRWNYSFPTKALVD